MSAAISKPKERPLRAVGPTNVGTEAQSEVVAASQALQADREALRLDYCEVFSGARGERVFRDLLRRYGWSAAGVEMSSYRSGMGHADMCFVEGQKEVVRYILTQTERSIL